MNLTNKQGVVPKNTFMILRLILGDQLNHHHTWYDAQRDDVVYVMMEMRQETDYVAHHIQKVVAFFMAMRAFSAHLQAQNHRVFYFTLDHPDNQQTLEKNLQFVINQHRITRFEYQLPDEFRLDEQLKRFCDSLQIESQAVDSEHFLSERDELATFFRGKKTYLMESFYRMMRKKHNVLMDGAEPATGKWNYDADNRKALPKNHQPIAPLLFLRDVTEVYDLIQSQGVVTIGNLDPTHFIWPVTRAEGLEMLHFFVRECLPYFGTFQDAMIPGGWSLYHARVSFLMNSKILHPLEVIEAAVTAWETRPEVVSYSQVEGFVRQIIGWREYMRGVYWAKMPDYKALNFFDHTRKLPDWYWTGQTKMNCLKDAVGQSLDYAYAHHIQRLMVTGNFALLAGVHPDELDAWYLGIYIDAIEWVEITNTRGMSQFADGGIVGTKPYVSSANYIDKMSHYCTGCFYDKTQKIGPKACPFNALYWHFYDRHQHKLASNPRIGMMYQTWKKMAPETKAQILAQAETNLARLDEL